MILPDGSVSTKCLEGRFSKEDSRMKKIEHLPLDLLHTFAWIAKLDGDAAAAAEQLGISQPSISKRLTALRRVTSDPDREPWLILKGRRWRLTSEGQRVRGIVADLVKRYEQMEAFVAGNLQGKPVVSLACGQQAAGGFVRIAIEQYLKAQPECQVRLSTPRGKARIEGVAGGQFDLAIVTDSPATIQKHARREMYVEDLFEDRFVLAANPHKKSSWHSVWHSLPERPVRAKELLELPFILPEADASRRRQFDEWFFKATGKPMNITIETGGWQTILNFAEAGLGVGLVTASSVETFRIQRNCKLTTRPLDPIEFPPDAVRLIARKLHGQDVPDITAIASELRTAIIDSSINHA